LPEWEERGSSRWRVKHLAIVFDAR
jgi:hypothetical protein